MAVNTANSQKAETSLISRQSQHKSQQWTRQSSGDKGNISVTHECFVDYCVAPAQQSPLTTIHFKTSELITNLMRSRKSTRFKSSRKCTSYHDPLKSYSSNSMLKASVNICRSNSFTILTLQFFLFGPVEGVLKEPANTVAVFNIFNPQTVILVTFGAPSRENNGYHKGGLILFITSVICKAYSCCERIVPHRLGNIALPLLRASLNHITFEKGGHTALQYGKGDQRYRRGAPKFELLNIK